MSKTPWKAIKLLGILSLAAGLIFSVTGCELEDELTDQLDVTTDTDTGVVDTADDTGTTDNGGDVIEGGDGDGGAATDNDVDGGETDTSNGDKGDPNFVFNTLKIDGKATVKVDDELTLNNTMGNKLGMMFLIFLNSKLSEQINDGSFLMLSEFIGLDEEPQTEDFSINMLIGVNNYDDPADNFTGEGTVDVAGVSYDDNGDAEVILNGTSLEDGQFVAKGTQLMVEFPLPVGDAFQATLYNAVMAGNIDDNYQELSNVVIGGAIRKDEFEAALDLMPTDDMPAELPLNPESLMGMLGDPDTDTDRDGDNDAYSIVLTGEAVKVNLGETL